MAAIAQTGGSSILILLAGVLRLWQHEEEPGARPFAAPQVGMHCEGAVPTLRGDLKPTIPENHYKTNAVRRISGDYQVINRNGYDRGLPGRRTHDHCAVDTHRLLSYRQNNIVIYDRVGVLI